MDRAGTLPTGTAGPRPTRAGLGCFPRCPLLSGGGFSRVLQVPFRWLPDERWAGVRDLFNNWLAVRSGSRVLAKRTAAAARGARICLQ